MPDKLTLTQELVKILSFDNELSIDDLYGTIWRNLRKDGGFRLTIKGYELFGKYLELQHYTVKLDMMVLGTKTLLALDRKIKHPYYIQYKASANSINLILFDSKEAMLANLYGDLDKFLANYI